MGKDEKRAWLSTLLCLAFMITGRIAQAMALTWFPLLFIIAIIFGGWKQTSEGLQELIHKQTLNVDLLMALAAIGACIIGNWFEGAMLTFIFCLSGFLEEYTTNKSRKEITALMNLQPTLALKYFPDGSLEEVPVEEVAVGDLLMVPKGGTIPIDGIITKGNSPINEAAINGESLPAEKTVGAEVYGGTLNLGNALTVKVRTVASDTVMAKIVKLVEEAENQPTKTATFINKIENIYVKIVLIAVPLMIFLPYFFLGWSWHESFYRGMVLLVVASPCALVASATPATLAAISAGAKNGILVKGGAALERLSHLRAITFDKTGTLTEGRPVVTDAVFIEDSLLVRQMLLAMESQTTHPLSTAIIDYLSETTPLEENWQDLPVEEVTGFGLQCQLEGQLWRVGKYQFADQQAQPLSKKQESQIQQLLASGKTLIYLTRAGQLLAFLALQDVAKPEAYQVINYFKGQNIYTSMLTGDNYETASVISRNLGLDAFQANCLPEDKAKIIAELGETHGVNVMVGDGINDAPALANAAIGVAMGEGTDLAVDVADMVLMKNDLRKLQMAHQHAQKLERVIKQNIIFSIGVILLLILSNFVQILTLPLGVIGHEGSTILVILNGLRLLRMKSIPESNHACAPCPLRSPTKKEPKIV